MAVVCAGCGASNPDAASVCSLCHRPCDETTAPPPTAVGSNGFLVATPRPTSRLDEREFSRVKPGAVSFGLRGRLVVTGILLIPCFAAWFMMGGAEARSPLGLAVSILSILPMLFLPGYFLRDAWRSQRVR